MVNQLKPEKRHPNNMVMFTSTLNKQRILTEIFPGAWPSEDPEIVLSWIPSGILRASP